jgi:5-methyltetrahydrofolate corrinoid/iron sulfur protein methyltransferase
MQTIANNITSRAARVARLFKGEETGNPEEKKSARLEIQDIASSCVKAGADILEINLQQHYDRPEAMEFAVSSVQEVSDRQLCLSSGSPPTLEAGLKLCRQPPIVNFVTIDQAQLQEILPLVSRYQASVILLVSDPAQAADARQMLERAAILVGAANQMGIPNNRIWIDPGIFHITFDQGQRHLAEVLDVVETIPAAFSPPIKSTCWIGNSSSGAAAGLRPVIETHLLMLLAGLGLSSVFVDMFRPEIARALRLIKIFKNETIYADGLVEL